MLSKIEDRVSRLVKEGEEVIATRHAPPPHISTDDYVNSALFYNWKADAISFLQNVFGEESTHFKYFEKNCKNPQNRDTEQGLAVLRAAKREIDEGFLVSLSELAAADIFSDFLEMADHLLSQKYKDPAASLIGAVLEDGLRKMILSNGITLKSSEDISSLNKKLADGNVYNRLMQKKIQVWNDIRNNADHGKFSEYSDQDVKGMLNGVGNFLALHLVGGKN